MNEEKPRRKKKAGRRFSEEEIKALRNEPELYGEETVSGSMPNPEADDDTLKTEQEFGFYVDAETPEDEEIDPAKQIDEAEKARRRKRD